MKNNLSLPGRARALAVALLVVNAIALSWTSTARAADPPPGCSTSAGQITCVFAYTGGPQIWIVPGGATTATFYVYGAQGGTGIVRGGFGGQAYGTTSVTSGSAVQINVGGQGASASAGGAGGWNGGGAGFNPSGGGGGGTDVRRGACAASMTCTVNDRFIIGGGGGGGAGVDVAAATYYGGDGGYTYGTDGYPLASTGNGKRGVDNQGGAGGPNQCNGPPGGGGGGAGFGGAGANGCTFNGAGGGGGYFGGGGGGALSVAAVQGYSGGGGSGFVDPGLTRAGFNGARSGNGLVIVVTSLKAPVAAKSFSKAKADVDELVTLTFTITNPNAVAPLTFLQLTDDFPLGLVTVSPDGLREGCNGGVVSSPAGASYITMAGGMLPGGGICTFAVTVKGYTAGTYNNIAAAVTSDQTAAGNAASASIQVGPDQPTMAPIATKSFSQPTAAVGESVTLTLTVSNPNPTATLTGLQLTDTFPVGLRTVSAQGFTSACNGGVIQSGYAFLSMGGFSLPPGGSCTQEVTVTGDVAGIYVNTTNPPNADVVGQGSTASDTLTLSPPLPPAITKAFTPSMIQLNQITSLTFTITNPNTAFGLAGIAFTDSLPAGMVVATPNGLTNNCGGFASAGAGGSSASLAGATLAGGAACTMVVKVTATTLGPKNNSVQVTSNNAGVGNTSNATLYVATLPPTMATAFGVATIALGGSTSLTFTITNPNGAMSLTDVAFTDSLPAGLVVATPNGLTTTCDGTATAVAGASSASLSGATLAVGAACTVALSVSGATPGSKDNAAQATSTNGGGGNTSHAMLKVLTCWDNDTIDCNGFEAATIYVLGSGFANPSGVAVDTNGNVFVADHGNSAVKEILAVGGYATVNALGSGFFFPQGVAVDASGNVFVADTYNDAVKVILAPGYTTVNTLGSGFNHPSGVAVDASGNVFVADTYNNTVKVILAPGYTTVNTLGDGFNTPYGVAVDASGNVFVADLGNNAVKKILAPDYTTINTLGSGFNSPIGVAIDASSNVFVADSGNNAVKEILAAGGYTTVKTLGSGFNQPSGVAVDASGNVFVADYGNNTVKKILVPGGHP